MNPSYSNGSAPNAGYYSSSRRHLPATNDDTLSESCLQLLANTMRSLQRLWLKIRAYGPGVLGVALGRASWRLRRNMTARRIFSFPHLLAGFWLLLLLWGEYWVFDQRVEDCRWDKWEQWPEGANPHHLIFIADPQLIDPHTYPDRSWLLSELTVLITDNYLRKGYRQLQNRLRPDSVFFLGDLFDGGREWKTDVGDFSDPKWAEGSRPQREREYAKEWNEKYGENYWLSEYERFGDLFFKDWLLGGPGAGPWQRGRKIVASLPGNHDLGFGDEIKLPVRDRFSAYLGEPNRVDVIGNHSIVSVDTVSLSADSSDVAKRVDLKPIYGPANEFLENVKFTKRRAVEEELRFWRGDAPELPLPHKVESIGQAQVEGLPTFEAEDGVDFPTILLTHVPLYRDPGTPCGPLREHWPPAPKPAGQADPVVPDHRNAISISKGYQYQNVLSEDDSVKLVESVGNVVHVFSGDDHDYCEVVHSERKAGVREITVKSMSMAMGIPTPAFLMVSLHNPVDEQGRPIPGAPAQTLQTHLCLLPNQIATYLRYVACIAVSLAVIVLRAVLLPVLHLTPFTLAAEPAGAAPPLLPSHRNDKESRRMRREEKEKEKEKEEGLYGYSHQQHYYHPASATSGSSKHLDPSAPGAGSGSRNRSGSLTQPSQSMGGRASLGRSASQGRRSPSARGGRQGGRQWGWGEVRGGGLRIDVYRDDGLYDGGKSRWRPAGSGRGTKATLGLLLSEVIACTWRVAWVSVLFFAYLAYCG